MSIRQRCIDCIFFKKINHHIGGECRVNPPVFTQRVSAYEYDECVRRYRTDFVGHWPIVEQTDWCGRFLDKHIKSQLEDAQ